MGAAVRERMAGNDAPSVKLRHAGFTLLLYMEALVGIGEERTEVFDMNLKALTE